jgi:hypothetical protein
MNGSMFPKIIIIHFILTSTTATTTITTMESFSPENYEWNLQFPEDPSHLGEDWRASALYCYESPLASPRTPCPPSPPRKKQRKTTMITEDDFTKALDYVPFHERIRQVTIDHDAYWTAHPTSTYVQFGKYVDDKLNRGGYLWGKN